MAGSGTLAMDMAASNLIEPGDNALVLSTGYFGDRYAELISRYGAHVTVLSSPLGEVPDLEEVEKALKGNDFKLLTFTHVDTSTAVKVDPIPIGKLGQKYNVLTILDGVCSVAGEEIRQEDWGIDIVLTASQKAVGVPPGLALLVASSRAMEVFKSRKSPVGNFYADWNNWLPIMEAYESRKPSYFGTPAVSLVFALDVSLNKILEEGMDQRFERHARTGNAFRAAFRSLSLDAVPVIDKYAANTLSAPKYPPGVNGAGLLPEVAKAGAVFAGGLHPKNKNEYFRIGHMGQVTQRDVLSAVGALETGLAKCGYKFTLGTGINAAHEMFGI
jgi:alanine-glyoxylate transaminase/serine-glyoxylate transaminase/serine-pyruvate transaminase